MYFFIKKDATLPELRIELIEGTGTNYRKLYECLEGATITFSMYNADTRMFKVSNAPCKLKRYNKESCVKHYAICYEWKPRDTKEAGTYIGSFNIEIPSTLKGDGWNYPHGTLTVPIREPLNIIIE